MSESEANYNGYEKIFDNSDLDYVKSDKDQNLEIIKKIETFEQTYFNYNEFLKILQNGDFESYIKFKEDLSNYNKIIRHDFYRDVLSDHSRVRKRQLE